MKRFVGMLLAATWIGFLLTGCLGSPDLGVIPADRLDCAMGLTQMFRAVRPAIVKIEIYSAGGQKLGGGSGFFISPDGTLVTNYHVIERAGMAQALADDGRTWNVLGMSAADRHLDLAILKIEAANVPHLTLAPSRGIRVGQRVAALGNPLGMEGIISAGQLTDRADAQWSGEWIQFSAQVTGGYSGSPLLDECGRVIGVVTSRSETKPDENFASSSESIFRLREKASRDLKALPGAGNQIVKIVRDDRDYAQARFAYSNKKYAVAADLFRTLAGRYPGDSQVLIFLALSLQAAGQKVQAMAAFDDAIRIDPDFAAAYLGRGKVYEESGQHQKAIEDYDLAIRLNPDYASAYAFRGAAYAKMGRHREAILDYDQAIRLDPDDAGIYGQRGLAHILAGEAQKGCDDLREACRLGDCKALNDRKSSGACR